MADKDKALQGLERAAGRVQRAEAALRAERLELRKAVGRAAAAGVSQTAIGKALGVTRQRVKQMLEEGG